MNFFFYQILTRNFKRKVYLILQHNLEMIIFQENSLGLNKNTRKNTKWFTRRENFPPTSSYSTASSVTVYSCAMDSRSVDLIVVVLQRAKSPLLLLCEKASSQSSHLNKEWILKLAMSLLYDKPKIKFLHKLLPFFDLYLLKKDRLLLLLFLALLMWNHSLLSPYLRWWLPF